MLCSHHKIIMCALLCCMHVLREEPTGKGIFPKGKKLESEALSQNFII